MLNALTRTNYTIDNFYGITVVPWWLIGHVYDVTRSIVHAHYNFIADRCLHSFFDLASGQCAADCTYNDGHWLLAVAADNCTAGCAGAIALITRINCSHRYNDTAVGAA